MTTITYVSITLLQCAKKSTTVRKDIGNPVSFSRSIMVSNNDSIMGFF